MIVFKIRIKKEIDKMNYNGRPLIEKWRIEAQEWLFAYVDATEATEKVSIKEFLQRISTQSVEGMQRCQMVAKILDNKEDLTPWSAVKKTLKATLPQSIILKNEI